MKQHIDAFLSGADSDNLSLDDGDVLRAMILAMRRALLAVEWGYSGKGPYGFCEACGTNSEHPHEKDCLLDEALAKAGLPGQESRDAARKELGL